MKSVTGNIKIVLIFLGILIVTGCQSKAPKGDDSAAAAAETQPAADQADSGATIGDTYSVVRGDHLWGIASNPRIYGNPYHWPLIYKANADTIEDADLIQPGQSLTIARGSSAGEVDSAVRHAKTRGAWTLGVSEESDKAYLGR